MASNFNSGWHSKYGGRSNPNRGFNSSTSYKPGLRLHNYEGPYDPKALGLASRELSYLIERMQNNAVWHRLLRKIDVNTRVYGMNDCDDGFGESSNMFSQAGQPEVCDEQDEYENTWALERDVSKQTVTATVTDETSHTAMDEFTRNDNLNSKDDSTSSDCVIVDGTDSNESNDVEFIEKEEHANIIVIEDEPSDNSQIDNLFNSNEIDSSSNGKHLEQHSETEQTKNRVQTTFKCDLCAFVSESKPATRQHLENAKHFAASEYTLVEDGNMKLMTPMVLCHDSAKFKTVLVVCPDPACCRIFPDIYVCAEHYSAQHLKEKKEISHYGLLHVVEEEVGINNIDCMRCTVCKEVFGCRAFMNNHFNDTGHYPMSDVKGCQKLFFCDYCSTSFDTFEKVTSHQGRVHWKMAKNGAVYFTVFHYRTVECHTLVDYQSSLSEGTSAFTGICKRKHEGIASNMEPEKKRMDRRDLASRSQDENLNNTAIVGSNLNGDNMDTSRQLDSSMPGTSQGSVDRDSKGPLTELFKCDYCPNVTQKENAMYRHLEHDVHSSASTCLTDQDRNIVFLKESRTVMFEGANFKKVAAVCIESSCNLLFDTIFMCADHNIRCHHSKGGYYHVADIVDRIPRKVSSCENVCSVCGQQFRKSKQLNAHYKMADHFPFKSKGDCSMYTLCCYCNKTFSSFKVASGHVKKHQNMAKNGMLDVIILYVSKNVRKYTIPPYQPTKAGEVNSIRSKIANLQEMKKICGKRGRSELAQEIREMKQLL